MDKVLTVSVAAYNLENLIEQNLHSFEKCKNIDLLEVIVTDDGSTDHTAEIVSKYVQKYPGTFKLIKQKNSGAGSTVNSGIRHATGKYFKMIDGDDWVESENLDKLLENLYKIDTDIIITNYEVYDETISKVIEYKNFRGKLQEGKIIDFSKACNDVQFAMHQVTYRTSILKNNNIVLDNGFYTDVEYLLLPVQYLKTLIYYDLNIYVYRVGRNGQSVSLESLQKHIDMHDLVFKRLLNEYERIKNNLSNEKRNFILKRLTDMAYYQLRTLMSFEMTDNNIQTIKDFVNYIKNNSPEINERFSQIKKVKLLLKSNYHLIGFVSKQFRKEIN
ncbi:glycosyltransferase family 2 protein [Catenisphaera adipataccumulans]|uniref:Glycosyltransferase involved in cell wall biosynthesis n=1 Tax=Catenisphaera adipataccumulans TaxID=700500 RepID=A0A7W8CXE6_9FIRM|nr:glycosyltransferase family 2 protein [Catenisphaera adipataccumulans]MBB5183351.1 glycosyltransferase involved in cell wall biosynthesis [Catenisphaera adipataccumulans]